MNKPACDAKLRQLSESLGRAGLLRITARKPSEEQAAEERDRKGYSRQPQSPDESKLWEAEAAWPTEEPER